MSRKLVGGVPEPRRGMSESREVGVPTTLGEDSRFSNVNGGTSLLPAVYVSRRARAWVAVAAKSLWLASNQLLSGDSFSRLLVTCKLKVLYLLELLRIVSGGVPG